MTRYLLDTNHASVWWRYPHRIDVKNRAAPDSEFSLCLPSVGELWYMVFNSARVASNTAELELFLSGFLVVDFDSIAARRFGMINTELRRLGQVIPAIDMQIAAIAMTRGMILLTADAHFNRINGLPTQNWVIP